MSSAPASVRLRDAELELSRQLELSKQPGDEPVVLPPLVTVVARRPAVD